MFLYTRVYKISMRGDPLRLSGPLGPLEESGFHVATCVPAPVYTHTHSCEKELSSAADGRGTPACRHSMTVVWGVLGGTPPGSLGVPMKDTATLILP